MSMSGRDEWRVVSRVFECGERLTNRVLCVLIYLLTLTKENIL